MPGLNITGFDKKSFEEIRADIITRVQEELGSVNVSENSIIGQLISIVALSYSDKWELAEDVYFSQYLGTAEGAALDNLVVLIGLTRLQPTRTQVTVGMTGVQGTSIPVGSQVEVEDTGEILQNEIAGIITRANALNLIIQITEIADEQDYTVIINGAVFTYDSGVGASVNSIRDGLVTVINAGAEPVTASPEGSNVFIESDQAGIAFNLILGARLGLGFVTSPLIFRAQITGPVQAPLGSVNEIVTPISGLSSVFNPIDGVVGRNLETDEQLRLRASQSSQVLGSGSPEAIRARLRQEVPSVINAFIIENRSGSIDNEGRPPHSFETIVEGGANQDIADKLWELKPAGIETFGSVTVNVIDSVGGAHAISFSRPTPVFIWFEVDITIIAGEFPTDGMDFIRQNIVDFGTERFGVGSDILIQKFFKPVYEVAGIEDVDLRIGSSAASATPPASFDTNNISISASEIGLFDITRISVTIV